MHQRPDTGPDRDDRDRDDQAEPREKRLDLSVPQVAGSALAAVAAAVLASRLGVYGTIIGAGVVSVVATCGGSIFQHLFSRTGEQLREATAPARPGFRQVPVSPAAPSPPPPRSGESPTRALPTAGGGDDGGLGQYGDATTHGTRVRGWKRPLIAAAVVFGVAMGGITGYELLSGSGLDGSRGTTVGSVVRGGGDDKPAPSDTPSSPPDHDRTPERKQSPSPDGDHSPAPGQDGSGEPTGPAPSPSQPGPAEPAEPAPEEPAAPGTVPPAPTPSAPGTDTHTGSGADQGTGTGTGAGG
ncbi:hypothetical protein ACWEFL_08065 [Streptomyces sp. NPDC004838]